MESSKSYKKLLIFDGTQNVKEFITKCQLECSVKGYENEKKADFLGCRLVGPAFDCYMRLSDEDKKDFNAIRDELYQEFEKGNLDRAEAITVLNNRQRLSDESLQTYAYKLSDLVKLAYPSFTDVARNLLAKDRFVEGLHPSLQLSLKISNGFKNMNLRQATDEAVRLELAGVKSSAKPSVNSVVTNPCSVTLTSSSDDNFINSIAEKVAEKLQGTSINNDQKSDTAISQQVNWSGDYRGYRGRGRGRGRGSGRGRGQGTRKCRCCQSVSHVVRDCPNRYCQSCGKQGHDQFNSSCEKYQL